MSVNRTYWDSVTPFEDTVDQLTKADASLPEGLIQTRPANVPSKLKFQLLSLLQLGLNGGNPRSEKCADTPSLTVRVIERT